MSSQSRVVPGDGAGDSREERGTAQTLGSKLWKVEPSLVYGCLSKREADTGRQRAGGAASQGERLMAAVGHPGAWGQRAVTPTQRDWRQDAEQEEEWAHRPTSGQTVSRG